MLKSHLAATNTWKDTLSHEEITLGMTSTEHFKTQFKNPFLWKEDTWKHYARTLTTLSVSVSHERKNIIIVCDPEIW